MAKKVTKKQATAAKPRKAKTVTAAAIKKATVALAFIDTEMSKGFDVFTKSQVSAAKKAQALVKTAESRAALSAAILPYCAKPEQRDATHESSKAFYRIRNIFNDSRLMGNGNAWTFKTTKAESETKEITVKGKTKKVKTLVGPVPLVKSESSGSRVNGPVTKVSIPTAVKEYTREDAHGLLVKIAKAMPLAVLSAVLDHSDTEIKMLFSKVAEEKSVELRTLAANKANNKVARRKVTPRAKAKPQARSKKKAA